MARKSVPKTISLPPRLMDRVEDRLGELQELAHMDVTLSFYIQQLIRKDLGLPVLLDDLDEPPSIKESPDTETSQPALRITKRAKKRAPAGSKADSHTLPSHDTDLPA